MIRAAACLLCLGFHPTMITSTQFTASWLLWISMMYVYFFWIIKRCFPSTVLVVWLVLVAPHKQSFSESEKGSDLSCAVGITFGDVFVGTVGGTQRAEYTLHATAVNMAARLMSNAPKVTQVPWCPISFWFGCVVVWSLHLIFSFSSKQNTEGEINTKKYNILCDEQVFLLTICCEYVWHSNLIFAVYLLMFLFDYVKVYVHTRTKIVYNDRVRIQVGWNMFFFALGWI